MKVIQIMRRLAFEEWGGTETVVWNLSQQLSKKNIDNQIVATQALCDRAEEVVENIQIRRFPYFYPHYSLDEQQKLALDKKGGNPYSWPLYKYIKTQDCDILHCHTMQRIANLVRKAARSNKIPYIISFHGGFFDVPESEIQEMMKPLENTFNYGKIIDFLTRKNRFLKDADGILCVGYNEYEATRERFPDKIVEYLPNGVDYDKFQNGDEVSFRKKYKIPKDREIILCLSRIDYQKNQLILLELLNYMKNNGSGNKHLLLIGPISSQSYYESIENRIKNYELGDICTIIPGLEADDPDLVGAYQSADYFILPSIHEPFGIVVLEAWSAGVPVIASRVGGLQQLINDKETGLFFESESIESLIDAFETLEKDKKLRENLKENARKEVKKNYTWEIIAQKLTDFYKRVIDNYKK